MPNVENNPVKLSLPLEFQADIFREIQQDDVLILLARGLGILRIVTNLLHYYDAAGNNLVLLVGADERENGWIGESLAEHAAISNSSKARGLGLVNTDMMSVGTREKMYSTGGVFSITSRILIVDFLSGLLDPETVTGMIVLHAERIVATALEAFIIRIYRQKNKTGFLKAFSDNPEPFTTGFSPLATMMKNLFLRQPSLYPRFHVTVAKSLEGRRKAEVIELEVPMTDAMKEIQQAVMECVEISISELKKANTGLEMDDWNLDSALHKNFDSIVRRQLDPVWHRTSFRTRQIARDLTLLRNILQSLLTYDAVSFTKYLDTVLAASSPPPGATRWNQSPWLFLDAAHIIFNTAKRRVYTGKIEDPDGSKTIDGVPDSVHAVLEEQPKWALLAEILDEIERDNHLAPTFQDDSSGSILIMCGDQGTCRQLREFLQTMHGPRKTRGQQSDSMDDDGEGNGESSAAFMMRRKLRNYLTWKRDFAKVSATLFSENQKSINGSSDYRAQQAKGRAPPNKRRRIRGGATAAAAPSRTTSGALYVTGDKDSHMTSLLADLNPTEAEILQKGEIAADSLDNMDEFYKLFHMKDLLVIHPYDGDVDEHILEEIRPRYVIMYEPDAAFIRRVEIYRSSHTDRNVRVYFMYYGGSVEEQRYLSAVRREKDAFTRLIKERGSMAITLNHATHDTSTDPETNFLRTVNTRIAGGGRLAATAAPPRVVIDVREFRSSLPSLLHARSMIVVPCMLTVGDYVLTPTLAVERKSVRDLIGSLNNGRLYSQAETLTEHYKDAMLLIEFDAGKSFTLEPFADLSASSAGASALRDLDLQSKLVVLTLAFPRLRIIWSSSPYQTAEIFEELKRAQDEPDPIRAVQAGLQVGENPEDMNRSTFSQVPQDMLRSVPGVTSAVFNKLMLEVGSIAQLANMEEEELGELVGREAARQIFRFFNGSVFEE